MSELRIVFMGTPAFAVPSLRALIDQGFKVVGVFTQPDRPFGRGKKVKPSPVKEVALAYDIPVFQPERIRQDGVEDLKKLNPDVCVTVAFGQILSKAILEIPPLGTINVHASLLPKHRGSAPIQYALLHGDKETGITTMMTDVGIDTGDMLLTNKLAIAPGENARELGERLSVLGAQTLIETLEALEKGTLIRVKQREEDSTYDPMITKAMGELDFAKPSEELLNQIRALVPWPGTGVDTPGGRMKVWAASRASLEGVPGEVLAADSKQGLIVGTGDGSISLDIIQMPNGTKMPAKAYLQGNAIPLKENWLKEKK